MKATTFHLHRRILEIVFLILSLALLLVAPTDGKSTNAPPMTGTNQAPAVGILGDEFQISTSSGAGRPTIVYNSQRDQYLVAWNSNDGSGQIYGRHVSSRGTLASPAFVIANGDAFALAYNAQTDQYLVVWSISVPGLNEYDIYGKLLEGGGSPSGGGSFLIWHWANRKLMYPKVAWNSVRNEYFVIWNAHDAGTSAPTDISGLRVSAAGVPENIAHHLVDWPPNVENYSPEADIVYNPSVNQYYLVWRMRIGTSIYERSILGSRVDANGLQIPPVMQQIGNPDNHTPRVATNQTDRYFIVWMESDLFTAQSRLVVAQVNTNGFQEGIMAPISPWTNWMYLGTPALAAPPGSGYEFLIVWQMPTIVGNVILANRCRFDDPTNPVFDPWVVRVATGWNQNFPVMTAVKAAGRGYLIAYAVELAGGGQYVFGRLWWPQAPALFMPLIRKGVSTGVGPVRSP